MGKEWRVYYLFSDYSYSGTLLSDEPEPMFTPEWEEWVIALIENNSRCGEIYTLKSFQEAFNEEIISDQGWIIFREVEVHE